MILIGLTLEALLEIHKSHDKKHGTATGDILTQLADCARKLYGHIQQGVLSSAFRDLAGTVNHDGDAQKELDVLSEKEILEAMRLAPVAVYGSEETHNPVLLSREAGYAVCVDPLDGSSNIETNVSIGTIFSIFPVCGNPERNPQDSLLQPGNRQLAAGFFIYGPQLSLVVTLGNGTHVFTFSNREDTFVQVYENLKISKKTGEFAINASNFRHWEKPVRSYIHDCIAGASGVRKKDFNMRWIASLVADAYRILIRGGIFLYPGDGREGYINGRLRLVYEANPIAMLVEQAGGKAVSCGNDINNENFGKRILDIVPPRLHQRIPLVFGSMDEVEQVERYYSEEGMANDRLCTSGDEGCLFSHLPIS